MNNSFFNSIKNNISLLFRYAQGVVPTISKLTTTPIGLVKSVPSTVGAIKSVYSQHDEYYVIEKFKSYKFRLENKSINLF